jgi:hypothetical protein
MQPRTIRRSGQEAAAAAPESRPGPAAEPTPGPPPGAPYSEADAGAEAAAGGVYEFLTRFTAGVKRGLDDAGDGLP